MELRYTLVSDGSSDRMLMPAIEWLLGGIVDVAIAGPWADLAALPRGRALGSLADRVRAAVELYPCDVLFVHRDAEKEPRSKRVEEIRAALGEIESPPAVCVIPVRMAEAGLPFDEPSVRRAAGNPRGRVPLELPPLDTLECLPDAKRLPREALRVASELRGRHLRRFDARAAVHVLAGIIEDYSPLRRLSAFGALECDLRALVSEGPLTPRLAR